MNNRKDKYKNILVFISFETFFSYLYVYFRKNKFENSQKCSYLFYNVKLKKKIS